MKNPNWKQPTPLMQLRALTMAMEGNTSNWRNVAISEQAYCCRMAELSEDLFNLLLYVEKGSWDD